MPEEFASLRLTLPQAELCDRLRTAVESAATTNAHSMEALRLIVCEFTAALRDEGTTPEAVLISVKAVINNRALPVIPSQPDHWTGYELRELISTWSIKAYFKKRLSETR